MGNGIENISKVIDHLKASRVKIRIREIEIDFKESNQMKVFPVIKDVISNPLEKLTVRFSNFYDPTLFKRFPKIKRLVCRLPTFKPANHSIKAICGNIGLVRDNLELQLDLFTGFKIDDARYLLMVQEVVEAIDQN